MLERFGLLSRLTRTGPSACSKTFQLCGAGIGLAIARTHSNPRVRSLLFRLVPREIIRFELAAFRPLCLAIFSAASERSGLLACLSRTRLGACKKTP
ncbi:hypothetical protein ANAPC5_01500 [Anaplasma phagocytophilum]|nr:hypothetical protein ANAPC5_01500 [Anaplasma phagocytophilum]